MAKSNNRDFEVALSLHVTEVCSHFYVHVLRCQNYVKIYMYIVAKTREFIENKVHNMINVEL